MRFTSLVRKEFIQLSRNTTVLVIVLAMPAIQLLVLPLAADFQVKKTKITVVDRDHSTTSRRLTNKIGNNPLFEFAGNSPSYESALIKVTNAQADIILVIPTDFEKTSLSIDNSRILIACNAINAVNAQLATSYLNSILRELYEPPVQKKDTRGLNSAITIKAWYNPTLSYPKFMLPGILSFLITMVCVYLIALSISEEKETGTIEQINVSPIPGGEVVFGKMLPVWAIGLFIFLIGQLISIIVYDATISGSIGLLLLFTMVYVLAITGLGAIIGACCSTQHQAMFISFFFMLIFILLSGLFTPVSSMPVWAQTIAFLNPVTHYISVNRAITLKGSGIEDILLPFGLTAMYALIFNYFAYYKIKKYNG